jgi:F-type H+-transporting ATPase subunit b
LSTYLYSRALAATLAVGAIAAATAQHEPPAAGRQAQPDSPAAVSDAEHGSAAEHAGSDIFAGGVGNAIVTLIIFGAVVAVLGKYAWPRLLRVLDERERAIRQSLEEARREREQAGQLLERYEQQLDKARAEASAIVDEGRRDAEIVRRRIHDEAQSESDAMIARAKREIQLATDTAVKELYDRFADLAIETARGILREELTPERHKQLIEQSLERIRESDMRVGS